MKKILLIIMVLLLFGCDKKVELPTEEPVVYEKDQDVYHNLRLYTYNNSIPHIIRTYEEMDDETYGNYVIEMIDSNYEGVYTIKWRDLIKDNHTFASTPLIYEDLLFVNVQGVVSVHDLLTGTFMWEVETTEPNKGYAVFNDTLYVMYCDEDYITGIDLNTGEKKVHITDVYERFNQLYVDEQQIVAYYNTSTTNEKNGVVFTTEGSFSKRIHFDTQNMKNDTWDLAVSSDESEDAKNIIDGSLKTSWTENVKSYGEKEWVELTKQLPVLVHELVIYNGDQSSEKAYVENAKIKVAEISVGGGKSFEYVFNEFSYGQADTITFVKPITADYVLITIKEAEPGTLFKNTGITEVFTR